MAAGVLDIHAKSLTAVTSTTLCSKELVVVNKGTFGLSKVLET